MRTRSGSARRGGSSGAAVEDVAFRVIAGNLAPDHATIARFVVRHQDALAGLFGQVLALCARAGLVRAGTIAVDSTKMRRQRVGDGELDYERIAREIIARGRSRSTRPRMSSTATRAATSCRPSWPIPRPAGSGCGRPRPSWSRVGRPSAPTRSDARAPRRAQARTGRKPAGPPAQERELSGRSARAAECDRSATRGRSTDRRAGSSRATTPTRSPPQEQIIIAAEVDRPAQPTAACSRR